MALFRRSCDRTRFHPCGRRGTFGTLPKRWQALVKMKGGFGGHFSWQAQCLVNLDEALEGSKISFCETVVMFDFGHDDSVWQAQHFRCLGIILCGKLCRLQQECARNLGKTSFWHFQCSFFMVRAMFCVNLTCARAAHLSLCAGQVALVVARCEFWYRSRNPLGTLSKPLSLWRTAHFDNQADLAQRSWQEGLV